MSSGLKINQAKDNAAGAVISDKMSVQVSGLDIVQKNIQSGVSLLTVAEDGLNKARDILQRLRDICLAAANDTISDNERLAYENEANALCEELTRIQRTTKYNDINLFYTPENKEESGTDSPTVTLLSLNDENISVTSSPKLARTLMAKAPMLLSSIEEAETTISFKAGEIKEIEIDGKTYALKNNGSATEISYLLDTNTGEVSFNCSNFDIKCKNNVQYNVAINGSRNTITGNSQNDIFKTLNTTSTNNTFNGGIGDDVFNITSTNNTIYGNDGKDTFNISSSNNTIYGNADNDKFNVTGDNNKLYGQDGEDSFIINSGSNNTVDGGSGINSITDKGTGTISKNVPGNNYYVSFNSGEIKEIEILNGTVNTFTIINDKGSSNNLTYKVNEAGQLEFIGSGFTIKGDENKKNNVYINSQTSAMTYIGGNLGDKISGNNAIIQGGAGNDTINVTSGTIHGGAGKDTITTDNAIVYGEDGDDTITTNSGTIYGGNGDDTITTNNGVVYGGSGNDTIIATNTTTIYGEDGNDTIKIQGNNTKVYGGSGNDNLISTSSNIKNLYADLGDGVNSFTADTVTGSTVMADEHEDNILNVKNAVDSLFIGFKNDKDNTVVLTPKETRQITIDGVDYQITNTSNKETKLVFRAENSKVSFSGQNVNIIGLDDVSYTTDLFGTNLSFTSQNKNDTIRVIGGENIEVHSGDGDDTLTSGASSINARLYGDGGNDNIYIYGESSSAYGGKGDDNFHIESSSTVDGGEGNDKYQANVSFTSNDEFGNNDYAINGNSLNVSLGGGTNNIKLTGINNQISAHGNNDKYTIQGNTNTIYEAQGSKYTVNINNSLNYEINNLGGGTRNMFNYNLNISSMQISGSNLEIQTPQDRSNNITLRGNSNIINAGDYADIITIAEGSNNTLNTFGGNDVITLNSENNSIKSGDGKDTITINASSNREINAGNGNNIININSNNNTAIKAGDGNNTINCSASGNNVTLGDGNNAININNGNNNTIKAGSGSNNFENIGNYNNLSSKGEAEFNSNGQGNTFESSTESTYDITGNNNSLNAKGGGTITLNGNSNNINANKGTEYEINGDLNTLIATGGFQLLNLQGNKNDIEIGANSAEINITGNENIYYSEGTIDTMTIYGDSNNIDGTDESDTIFVSGNKNIINEDDGDNRIVIEGNENEAFGGLGDDTFIINSGSKNSITGGGSSDSAVEDHGSNTVLSNITKATIIDFQIGANKGERITQVIKYNAGNLKLSFSDRRDAERNISKLDKKINQISSQIASIGSTINRLESIYEVQTTNQVNLVTSKSVIKDADMAHEASNFTKSQILQNLTTSLLGQANSNHTNKVLNLLPSRN